MNLMEVVAEVRTKSMFESDRGKSQLLIFTECNEIISPNTKCCAQIKIAHIRLTALELVAIYGSDRVAGLCCKIVFHLNISSLNFS